MPILSAQEQQWLEYLQSLYPVGMRSAAEDTDSVLRTYDYVRIFVINMLATIIKDGSDQLVIGTATDMGLSAREVFLKLPNGSLLSVVERRARIKAKLSKADSTVRNVRQVIESFLPLGEIYNIREMRSDPTFTVDDTRTYMVEVSQTLQTTLNFDILKDILEKVHPAHCTMIMNYITYLLDNIGINSEVTGTYIHSFFVWADELTPASTDTIRGDENNPLSGQIWGA